MNDLRKLSMIGLLLLIAAACSSAPLQTNTLDTSASVNQPAQPPPGVAREMGLIADGEFAPQDEAQIAQEPSDDSQPFGQRVILKNASLTLTVETPATRITEIAAMAEAMGGWVVSSNSYTTTNSAGDETTSGTIVVRVPAERLDEALAQIKSGALKIDNENITGDDVTQQYVDLSSRLENLQASEQQLREIMDKAVRVADVLEVQRELTNVRGEIEVIQGRLNYFNEAAAFSSISVSVIPQPPGPVEVQTIGWNPGTTAENALGALVSVLQSLLDAAITVVIVGVPLALLVSIPLWLIWRSRRRGFSRSAS